jgi:hypothetical protein
MIIADGPGQRIEPTQALKPLEVGIRARPVATKKITPAADLIASTRICPAV